MRVVRLARAVIAIHSTRRGPAFGGIRRRRYADMAEAEADARRLAEAMSLKCALAGLPAGGGKAVIPDNGDPAGAYAELGKAIEELGGQYVCGPDVGTGERELAWVREQTRWVNPIGNEPSRATARGVLAGLRAVLRVQRGGDAVAGLRFVVQGLGNVGRLIAAALVAGGGEVLGADIAEVDVPGVARLDAGAVVETPCDVWIPCALGGILDIEAARRTRARAICGAANNQLLDAAAGEALAARGIPWAPDFLVSAGAVIEGVLTIGGAGRDEVASAIDEIGPRCEEVLREARRRGVAPLAVASERARAALQ